MSRFIRLSNMIINTHKIINICVTPSKYTIELVGTNISGISFMFGSVGFGSIDSHSNSISVFKEKVPDDYNIITKWIDTIDT